MINAESDNFANCIFRYRKIDSNGNNLTALKNNRLYFSTPRNFNDPYDNLMYINVDRIVSDVERSLSDNMNDYIRDLKRTDEMMACFAETVWDGEDRECQVEGFLNDIISAAKVIKSNVRKNVKIICFSTAFDSMLMWSHYAENHKGYVIAYHIDDIKDAACYNIDEVELEKQFCLEKVIYVNEQIDMTEDIKNYIQKNFKGMTQNNIPEVNVISQERLKKFITQKSIEWKTEKEWRVIPDYIKLNQESPMHYLECVPRGIILGADCKEENKKLITVIADEKNIPVYRMSIDELSRGFSLSMCRDL